MSLARIKPGLFRGGRALALVGAAEIGLLIALAVLIRRDDTPRAESEPGRELEARAPTVLPARMEITVDTRARDHARTERETVLASVRDSGSAAEVWDAQAAALVGSINNNGVACFVAGCATTFTFSDEADYSRRIETLGASDDYRAWTGGKRLTAPEVRNDGSVVVALVLYRPD